MRYFLLPLSVAFVLFSIWSCQLYYPDLQASQQAAEPSLFQARQGSPNLINLSAQPHQGNVEVFFTGESRPTRLYLQLRYLSATKNGYDDVNSLVINLKEQARLAGAHGIIITETRKWVSQAWVNDVFQEIPKTDVDALAFVYPDSLKFDARLLKAWNLYLPDSTGQSWVFAGAQSFDFDGQPLGAAKPPRWLQWWFEHTHPYLVENQQNLVRFQKDEMGRTSVRVISPQNTRIALEYTGTTQQVSRLKVSIPEIGQIETITYQYLPESSRIASREFIPALDRATAFPYLIEYPEYDQDGQVKAFLYLKKNNSGVRKQAFRVEMAYYTQQEWEAQVKALIREQWGE